MPRKKPVQNRPKPSSTTNYTQGVDDDDILASALAGKPPAAKPPAAKPPATNPKASAAQQGNTASAAGMNPPALQTPVMGSPQPEVQANTGDGLLRLEDPEKALLTEADLNVSSDPENPGTIWRPTGEPHSDARFIEDQQISQTGSYVDTINGLTADDQTFVEARNKQAFALADEKTHQAAIKASVGKTLEGEILAPATPPAPGSYTFESRIKILDAYQFMGAVATAPAWVDRNMVGFADYDQVRGLPPGPCLRVPTGFGEDVVICRVGDFITRQEVLMDEDHEPEVKIEVWDQMQFLKMFMPQKVAAAQAKADAAKAAR